MTHKKINLAEKQCPFCEKPFSWRKKWQSCWDEVKYCSERCRRNRNSVVNVDNQTRKS
ncbi:DUF2256 domain-containing protein [Cocleimonas sp. KMM 6892]|uniref:DUF2256 domain-containing protein n=1 Tax=unclassified Cocleimonas TaxID=2639732 RepID=UPI002DBD8277|nr:MULTISPECIES: DUF2256 domain-containing protein [unclassified Cocleimonas]MEB8431719.1 DUF2256 domain-containing protein [Cocleimonas sp. KMM 6892]MEC4715195.1 DUF2256 domain-containing protein [Cocleimonas sp. KMM 6895]MEC4743991.1 DUF2256 domain-containing protein [Cocleimonas sp. KMM 6896]